MKPIKDWTREERSHFLTLFMGRCWHEWDKSGWIKPEFECDYEDWGVKRKKHTCLLCHKDSNSLSHSPKGFLDVKSFMEKEWPEMWEEYLQDVGNDIFFHTWNNAPKIGLSFYLDSVLNPSNLVTFLLESEPVKTWGWVKCSSCHGDWLQIFGPCPTCDKGKIKHSALIFAEKLK